ncbi:MAG: hypothetical protein CL790_06670 [Chloroflexi bacterium]|nr:hypothetical protein [Chloroflexota bacterium]
MQVTVNKDGFPTQVARTKTSNRFKNREGARSSKQSYWSKVTNVIEVWRIDDEWWRIQPIQRTYFRVLLEEGYIMTVFRNDAGKDKCRTEWFEQTH